MRSFIFFFLFFFSTVFSSENTPFQQASLSSEPSAYVANSVNAITGDYIITQPTVTVQGAEPITLNLQYVSSCENFLFTGWSFQANVTLVLDPEHESFQYIEKNGLRLSFGLNKYALCREKAKGSSFLETKKGKKKRIAHNNKIRETKNNDLQAKLLEFSYKQGLCHCPYYDVTGRINLKNTKAFYRHNDRRFTIKAATGEDRFYWKAPRQPKDITKGKPDIVEDAEIHPKNKNQKIFLLRQEKLPNGNLRFYEYDKYNHLTEIQTTNAEKTKIYAWVKIHYLKTSAKSRSCDITTSDGKVIQLRTKAEKLKVTENDHKDILHYAVNRISSLKWPGQPEEKYTYQMTKIIERTQPLKSAQKITYYKRKHENDLGFRRIKLKKGDDSRCGRVLSLRSPIGEKDSYFDTHRFVYHPDFTNEGWASTDVYDVDENKTEYRYKSDLRLYEMRCFQKKDNNSKCIKKVTFSWGKEGSDDVTLLLAKSIWDGSNTPLFSHRYYYDKQGNVIQEKIFGNLSGQSEKPLSLDKDNLPQENSAEIFCKKRKFSQDGKNLLLEEEDDTGICTKMTYLPRTDLIESQLILFRGEVKTRNFFEYNPENILVRILIDDGSSFDKNDLTSVSERKITVITPKVDMPFIGMPASVDDRYLELSSGQEKLLQRRDIHYSSKGYIEKEDIYDADGQYRYSSSITYDEEGRPITKTNALGQQQIIRYDENFREKYFQDFGSSLEETKRYDAMGRLKTNTKTGTDGLIHEESFSYDKKSNLIASKNYLGNETKYKYSAFGELLEEISPQVEKGENSSISPTQQMRYDGLGRVVEKVDALGHVTKTTYNAYNKPLSITYPDGSTEKSIYYLDGSLKTHIDQLGTKTHYTYDYLKRVTSTQLFSAVGELLAEETATYNAFHQLSKTDANGITTTYTYDGAGRKIREEIAGSVTEIEYDALGRDYKQICHVDSGDVVSITIRDLLDRVIEERIEDEEGNLQSLISYAYDAAGNKTSKTNYISGRECVTSYGYDSFSRLIKKIDPSGNVSSVKYNENYHNALSERVLLKEITDPLGRKTFETVDALGRSVLIEKRSKENTLLFHEEFFYDEIGNVLEELRWVLSEGNRLSSQVTAFTYDVMNRKILQSEAANTTHPKIYSYAYDPKGHLLYQKNPNGLELNYGYDALGRKIFMFSSDGKCRYEYLYDRAGNLIEARDALTHQVTQRQYDALGQMTYEKLANGLWVGNSFDKLGRKTKLAIPDGSFVSYSYEGSSLESISRKATGGEELYCHRFTDYDFSGNCLEEEMIGSLGSIQREFTSLGQIQSLSSPYAHQEASKLDAIGKILKLKTSSSLHQEEVSYAYDDLDQLEQEYGSLFPHDFACDSLSNRLRKDTEIYNVNDLNQLLSTDEREYAYDPNGNPLSLETKKKSVRFEYDPLDRLISVTIPRERHVLFVYDAFHRRVSKERYLWINGEWCREGTTRYLYDEEKEIGEIDEDGIFKSFRVLNPQDASEIGSAIAVELSGIVYAPLHDVCGNVLGLVSLDDQKLLVHNCYSAFGEHIKKYAETDLLWSVKESPWLFSSKRYDGDVEMFFFGRRFYDPEVGRWMTPDPAGFTDGPNLYAYVYNNPLSHIDHYGLYAANGENALTPVPGQPNCYYGENYWGPVTSVNALNLMSASSPNNVGNPYGGMFPSNAYQATMGSLMHVLGNPRLQGSLQAMGGLFEAGVGAGMTLLSGSIAAPFGWFVMSHGLDQFFTGIHIAVLGSYQDSATSQFLQKTGMPSQTANLIDGGLSVFGTMGGIAVIRVSQITAFPRFYLPENYGIGFDQANEQILFGQKSVSAFFSETGTFESKPISEVVQGLKNGTISPESLPIEIIVRNGQRITLNNRSLLALRRTGIEPKLIINRTRIKDYEFLLDKHLRGNLPSDIIKIRGGPPGTSLVGPLE